jgi:hypothetical protein
LNAVPLRLACKERFAEIVYDFVWPPTMPNSRKERVQYPTGRCVMSGENDLTDRVQRLEAQVAELQKAIEVLFHNPNWHEVISLSPTEIEQWARAIKDGK